MRWRRNIPMECEILTGKWLENYKIQDVYIYMFYRKHWLNIFFKILLLFLKKEDFTQLQQK